MMHHRGRQNFEVRNNFIFGLKQRGSVFNTPKFRKNVSFFETSKNNLTILNYFRNT